MIRGQKWYVLDVFCLVHLKYYRMLKVFFFRRMLLRWMRWILVMCAKYYPLQYCNTWYTIWYPGALFVSCIHGFPTHYCDVIMGAIAYQITSLTIVYSTVYSDANQRKHQSSASLAFVWGIHRGPGSSRTNGLLRGNCFHFMASPCVSQCYSQVSFAVYHFPRDVHWCWDWFMTFFRFNIHHFTSIQF